MRPTPTSIATQGIPTMPKTPCPPGFVWSWHPVWKFWFCKNLGYQPQSSGSNQHRGRHRMAANPPMNVNITKEGVGVPPAPDDPVVTPKCAPGHYWNAEKKECQLPPSPPSGSAPYQMGLQQTRPGLWPAPRPPSQARMSTSGMATSSGRAQNPAVYPACYYCGGYGCGSCGYGGYGYGFGGYYGGCGGYGGYGYGGQGYAARGAQAGFDCIDYDDQGNCVVLKRAGTDVNLKTSPIRQNGPLSQAGGGATKVASRPCIPGPYGKFFQGKHYPPCDPLPGQSAGPPAPQQLPRVQASRGQLSQTARGRMASQVAQSRMAQTSQMPRVQIARGQIRQNANSSCPPGTQVCGTSQPGHPPICCPTPTQPSGGGGGGSHPGDVFFEVGTANAFRRSTNLY